jgi:Fe-S-cluster containining protein
MGQGQTPQHIFTGEGNAGSAERGETLQSTVRQATQVLLRTARTPETAYNIMERASRQAAALVEQSPQRATHACAAGCYFCCYLPVDVTVLEALGILAYSQKALTPEAFAAMQQRLAATAAKVRGLSFEEHARARLPCALLVDGRCSVYPSRPLACRAWNSTSVDRCEEVFRGDPVALLPPLDTCAYDAVWGMARGIAAGLKQARLNNKTYELHSILQRLLETPNAAQRWLQGEDVVAGCTLGAFPS